MTMPAARAPGQRDRLSTAITDLMVIGEIVGAIGTMEPMAGETIEGTWLCWLSAKIEETTAEASDAFDRLLKADLP